MHILGGGGWGGGVGEEKEHMSLSALRASSRLTFWSRQIQKTAVHYHYLRDIYLVCGHSTEGLMQSES